MDVVTADLFLFNDICRFCCLRKGTTYPLFEDSEENLGPILKDVLPNLNIIENDSKPQKICYECRSKLKMFNDFLLQCKESESRFNSCMKEADRVVHEEIIILEDCDSTVDIPIHILTPQEMSQKLLMKMSPTLQTCDTSEIIDLVVDQSIRPNVISNIYTKVNLVENSSVKDSGVVVIVDKFSKNLTSGSLKNKVKPRSENQKSTSKKNSGISNKQVQCSVCGKTFGRQARLNAHMQLHTGMRAYKCTRCDKSFTTGHDLTKHLRLHDAALPCETCGNLYTTKTRLERHKLLHRGVKPYQCEICGKLFSNKEYMRLHVKAHNSKKSYICIFCPSVFKDSWSLHEHFDKIHSSTPSDKFDCPICDKSFKWRTNYNRHMKKHNLDRGTTV